MKIKVMSERKYEGRSFYQVAWEWEDAILETFDTIQDVICDYDFVKSTKFKPMQFLYKYVIPKNQIAIKRVRTDKAIEIYFPLRVWHCNQYLNRRMIPIFLDAYMKDVSVIYKMTRKLPLYFVTCLDILEEINSRYPSSKVHYMPLSIADKWISKTIPQKDIDVIQVGRKSEFLHCFMMRYCKEHPNVNYVYLESSITWDYISTINGRIGKLATREDYMNTLRRAKISLVSTPGIETGRFGDLDFFTPRFFESAASYCRMIGHYTKNKEAQMLNIEDVCPSVNNYNEFSDYMDRFLNTSVADDKNRFDNFINQHKTSKRAKQILKTLQTVKLI